MSDLCLCSESRVTLTNKAKKLSDRYEDIVDKQMCLTQRYVSLITITGLPHVRVATCQGILVREVLKSCNNTANYKKRLMSKPE